MHYSYSYFQLVIVILKGHRALAKIMVNVIVMLMSLVTNVIHVNQVIPAFLTAKVKITTNSNPTKA